MSRGWAGLGWAGPGWAGRGWAGHCVTTVCCRGGRGLHRGRHAGGRGDQAAGAGAGHGGEALQSDAASPQLRMRRTRRTPPARWTAWSPCSASRSARAWRRRARRWRGCRRGCPPSSWGTRRTWCGPAACRLKVTSPAPCTPRSVSSSPDVLLRGPGRGGGMRLQVC